MRRRKSDLPARVNGNLHLQFGDVRLTSYAGLEPFGQYLRQTDFNALLRQACAGAPAADSGLVRLVHVVLALLVVGGRRLRHLAFVQDDVVVQRFAGLRVIPTARTVSRWLQRSTMRTVRTLQTVNAAVVARVLPRLQVRTLTVDVDGTVVSTGLQVERIRPVKCVLDGRRTPRGSAEHLYKYKTRAISDFRTALPLTRDGPDGSGGPQA